MKLFKKYMKEYLLIIVILTLVLGVALNNTIAQNDESTLFGETLKMYNGYKIYKEINVLVTPLFFYLGFIFFKIFGANYLIYRIFGTLIWLFLFFNIYKLLEELKMKKKLIFITELVIFMFLEKVIKIRSKLQYISHCNFCFGNEKIY